MDIDEGSSEGDGKRINAWGGEEDGQNETEEEAVKDKQCLAESRGECKGGRGAAMPASPFRPYKVAW